MSRVEELPARDSSTLADLSGAADSIFNAASLRRNLLNHFQVSINHC